MRFLLPLCRGAPARSFYQDFHQGLSDGLRALGHDPRMFLFGRLGEPTQAEAEELVRHLERDRIDAVIDIACWGYGLSGITVTTADGSRQPIFDLFDVACVGMLFDHPYNQAVNGIRSRRLLVTCPDRDHPNQMPLAFPGLRLDGMAFIPPAVRPLNDCSEAGEKARKPIDVLFIGNFVPAATERFWKDTGNPLWSAEYDAGFCDALADALVARPEQALHLGAMEVMAALGRTIENLNVNRQLRAVEWFLRHRIRRDAVSALAGAGIRMSVAGDGWDEAGLPANVQRLAATDYDGFFRLAAQARICLDASTYLNGANDRVFSYLLNRAVCFTNARGYLAEVLAPGQGVHFYSLLALPALADEIRSLLARPEVLREEAERGREIVRSAHTWKQRLPDVLAALGPARAAAAPSPPDWGAGYFRK